MKGERYDMGEQPFTSSSGETIDLTVPPRNTWEKKGMMVYFYYASIAFLGTLELLSFGYFRASEKQVKFMTVCFYFFF